MKSESSAAHRTEVAQSAPIVLLVDDEPDLLHALTRVLRQQPYRINTARSAEEAMDILKAHRVDLIVSDESMPGTCGTRFLSWVADNFPEVTRIMLTGRATVPSALRAINEGGVYRYFTKPCDMVELALAIRHGLEEKDFSQTGQLGSERR